MRWKTTMTTSRISLDARRARAKGLAKSIIERNYLYPQETGQQIADAVGTSPEYVRAVRQRYNLTFGVSPRIGPKSVSVDLNPEQREKVADLASRNRMTAARFATALFKEALARLS